LKGKGVTSLIINNFKRLWATVRITGRRPFPGPLTISATRRAPAMNARELIFSATNRPAKLVFFFDPLNPHVPADSQSNELPAISVRLMMVLLNVALTQSRHRLGISGLFAFVLWSLDRFVCLII
jgi:hypothetical protein